MFTAANQHQAWQRDLWWETPHFRAPALARRLVIPFTSFQGRHFIHSFNIHYNTSADPRAELTDKLPRLLMLSLQGQLARVSRYFTHIQLDNQPASCHGLCHESAQSKAVLRRLRRRALVLTSTRGCQWRTIPQVAQVSGGFGRALHPLRHGAQCRHFQLPRF